MSLVDLSISRKGLVLVSVPLLFELGFIAALLPMLQASERIILAQTQSKDMMATSSELNKRLLTAGYVLFLWKATHSPSFVQRYQACVDDARKLCARLSQVSKGNARREEHTKRIIELSEKIIYLTSNFAHSQETSMLSLMGKDTYHIELEHSFQAFLNEVQSITQEEEQIQAGGSSLEERAKAMVYVVIFGAAGLSILISILLAVYLNTNITRRLSIVMNNTELLASRHPLNSLVDGNDEIAKLDRVFHRMATVLEHSERMKSEFVSMITHDLKAPLTSIQTAVSLLSTAAKRSEDEKEQRRFGVLERNVSGMIKLVNDLLDMDKIEGGVLRLEIEKADILGIINQAVESMRFFADQYKVELLVGATNVLEVECDQKRIEQVLINLITNSVKFSPPGGKVSISSIQRGQFIEVSVKDEGRGIPAQDIEKIFDRFKQVEQEDSTIKGGTGLGLAICKALVELHHGTISVTSSLGRGSTFVFRLPIVQPRIGSMSEAKSEAR
jgi:signal transduction histidine kinase